MSICSLTLGLGRPAELSVCRPGMDESQQALRTGLDPPQAQEDPLRLKANLEQEGTRQS